jgi:hypothetical protein
VYNGNITVGGFIMEKNIFSEKALIWDFINLLESCKHYAITDYEDERLCKDFLWKYNISYDHVLNRINDLVNRYGRGAPGKKQLVKKVHISGRKKQYAVTEEGHEILGDGEHKELASNFTLIFLKEELTSILRDLQDLEENSYVKEHWIRRYPRDIRELTAKLIDQLELEIVAQASHFYTPMKNYFDGLARDLPGEKLLEFLSEWYQSGDTYYTFNLIRQLYFHSNDYLKKILMSNQEILREMLQSLEPVTRQDLTGTLL